ncbi:hypothetical protein FB567DRAFT_599928 [Paraphoma chrysanthemicola]|uniref:Carrier domain-containing protein n=1 Tax=Paraphoma chrysanthemicola TaxID=798071 RepID=A0A8K0W4P0_9PLEO|nr:hypothetical protein FB567DRAFT_599928 [Paraphoma chrysanthemicola]
MSPETRETNLCLSVGPDIDKPSDTILTRLSEITASSPDRIAAKHAYGSRISFQELTRRAIAISTALRSRGIEKATPICVLGPATIDGICAVLAICCIGCIYVPIDHRESTERNAVFVDSCNTDICIVNSPVDLKYAQSMGLANVFVCSDLQFVDGVEVLDDSEMDGIAVALDATTTAAPTRVVMLTHEILMAVMAAPSYFAPADDNTAATSTLIKHEGVNVTVATPSEYSAWFRSGHDALRECGSWKLAFCVGENIPTSVVRSFSALENTELDLVSVYASTGYPIAACMGIVDHKEYVADTEGKLIPAGPALPGYQVWIGDTLGRPVFAGWKGEIWIAGPGIGAGFFGGNEDNREFRVDSESGVRSYRTPDYGFLNDEGVLFVVSRPDVEAVVRLRDYYVDLVDVERTIVNQSGGQIEEGLVMQQHEDVELLQAFVVMASSADMDTPRFLQTLLRGLSLPNYLRPASAVVLDAIPLTLAGKADRQALKAMTIAQQNIIPVVQPASSFGRSNNPKHLRHLETTERAVLSIWQAFLPNITAKTNIISTSDFFSLGGDTATLSRILDRMRVEFRATLMLTDLAHNPTLRGMTTVAMNKISIFTLGGTTIDWKAETALPMTSSGPGGEDVKEGQNLVVLLTGTSGFLGQAVLQCLKSAPNVSLIHCVAIRSPDKTTPHAKVIYHPGNLTQPHFGMSNSDWNQLSLSVDVIIHLAALVDHIRPYSSLRTTNVLPTKKVVQLAAPRKIPIHYISSASVGRFTKHPIFPEMGVAQYPPPIDADGYTASKWASEVVLEKAHSKLQIPVMIHRPTTLVGNGVGEKNVMANLLHFSKELHTVPELRMDGAFDFVNIETAARTIIRDVLGGIQGVNFSNIGGMQRIGVLGLGNEIGGDVRTVEMRQWVELAKGAGMSTEMAHVFEEWDEHVKSFVGPDIRRSREMA